MRFFDLIIYLLPAVVCSADLYNMVHNFETLDSVNLHVVARKTRSTGGIIMNSKHISFESFGRKFNMVLFPGSSVIGPDFKSRTVDGDGRIETFVVDPNNFYSGFLEDDNTVEVDAHFEDGILSSNTYFPNETFVTEPAWRHRLNSNATMIVYRRSDVNWDEIFPIDPNTGERTRMMDGIRLPGVKIASSEEATNDSYMIPEKLRHKRAVQFNTCPVLTVADFLFFRDMGNRRRGTTAAIIISTMQSVNRYFKRTIWDDDGMYVNMGFHIKEMIIHTQFTTNPPDHYNADRDWTYNTRLNAFSKFKKLTRVCIGHLFTSYSFQDNVLGLAFIASENHAEVGGVCSLPSRLDGALAYPRTSWSSAKNGKGEQVLTLQFDLVVTHGHNWGAEHDPLTPECGPDSRHNGKYVMWPYSVPGYEENNKFFSPCSRRYIVAVLRSKAPLCFKGETYASGLCGNGIIERNEECDPGVVEEGQVDACCSKDCKLRSNAKCSGFNNDCCKDCQVANTSVRCSERNELACKNESFCDGRKLDCPLPGNLPDNTSCIDKGECYRGRCLNFCEIRGRSEKKVLVPCLCTQNGTAMCRRCCTEMKGKEKGECLPTTELLDEGRTCLIGMCENGICIKLERQFTVHFFNFIKHLTVNKLLEVMRSNIVATVVALSLIIWIPTSLIISCMDRRNRRKRMDLQNRFRAEKANPKATLQKTPSKSSHRPGSGTSSSHSIHDKRLMLKSPASSQHLGTKPAATNQSSRQNLMSTEKHDVYVRKSGSFESDTFTESRSEIMQGESVMDQINQHKQTDLVEDTTVDLDIDEESVRTSMSSSSSFYKGYDDTDHYDMDTIEEAEDEFEREVEEDDDRETYIR